MEVHYPNGTSVQRVECVRLHPNYCADASAYPGDGVMRHATLTTSFFAQGQEDAAAAGRGEEVRCESCCTVCHLSICITLSSQFTPWSFMCMQLVCFFLCFCRQLCKKTPGCLTMTNSWRKCMAGISKEVFDLFIVFNSF